MLKEALGTRYLHYKRAYDSYSEIKTYAEKRSYFNRNIYI